MQRACVFESYVIHEARDFGSKLLKVMKVLKLTEKLANLLKLTGFRFCAQKRFIMFMVIKNIYASEFPCNVYMATRTIIIDPSD